MEAEKLPHWREPVAVRIGVRPLPVTLHGSGSDHRLHPGVRVLWPASAFVLNDLAGCGLSTELRQKVQPVSLVFWHVPHHTSVESGHPAERRETPCCSRHATS